ncbi:MAG: ankyrin repeat domain-containing protein [Gammaproteobacteria bacterium]|jgi:ankyrin repeat protein|nr:ankyrin repeat domain-containing protein [Gammaproteobacteria bacterium]
MDKKDARTTVLSSICALSLFLFQTLPTLAGPLHDAAAIGDLDRVKHLIAHGADVNAKDTVRLTALDYATFMNHRSVVETLIASGANVNAKDVTYGLTPLHMAAKLGHRSLAELLIANGADVEARADGGGTPLHWAALMNLKPLAELLIAKGANVNVKDRAGATPLQWAKAHAGMVELLKRHGAKE